MELRRFWDCLTTTPTIFMSFVRHCGPGAAFVDHVSIRQRATAYQAMAAVVAISMIEK